MAIKEAKNQREGVLRALKQQGSITPLEAIGVLGCFRLGARIFELRKEGHRIQTVRKVDSRGKPYFRYVYEGGPNAKAA